MYNMLMCGAEHYWNAGAALIDENRFLEYTANGLAKRLRLITDEIASELKTLPTLFTYEAFNKAAARVGWITDIQRRQKMIKIIFEFDSSIPPIPHEQFQKMLFDLDIESRFEVNRSHWAVKEIDLLAILRDHGVISQNIQRSSSAFKFSRRTVLSACDRLKLIGHPALDRFLLELGIPYIDAGRNKGGLLARTTALGEYVVGHIDELTAEKQPLALAVVERAANVLPRYSEDEAENSVEPTIKLFWENLRKDGFILISDKITPAVTKRARHAQLAETISPTIRSSGEQLLQQEVALEANEPARVFIVHGREDGAKYELAWFLQHIGIEPVILHERPNGGRTLISKFQEESEDVKFAVILLTPDDVGGEQKPRARQNVIFELGFFIGRLGAQNVCALLSEEIEKPSDFEAVVWIKYGQSTNWRLELTRELAAAKIVFNQTAVFT